MGWTVLYIAFGIVALWLLGEVLLQYKARLRWRLLAFVGFLGVVLGVLMPSIVVICLGAATFAVGQTYVTLSFRRGFSTGWAVGGRPGASRRRKTDPVEQDPTLQVSDLAYEPVGAETYDHADTQAYPGAQPYPEDPAMAGYPAGAAAFPDMPPAPVYAPEPMPDETGQYGVYSDAAYAAAQTQPHDQAQHASYGYESADPYGYDQQSYGYDPAQQQYAAYSDPYIGAQQGYDAPYDPYAQQGYAQDAYAQSGYGNGAYATDTPPGGVWVPQQRDGDDPLAHSGELPPEQPYQNGYDQSGYGEQQYRY